jgi:membrane protease YdiL (CAAX protease family)
MVLLCFGWFMVSSLQALHALVAWRGGGVVSVRAFNDSVLGALVITEIVFAATALAVLQARGYPLKSLCPKPSWSGVLVAAGLYAGSMVLVNLVSRVVPHPDGLPLAEMVARAHVSLPAVALVAIVNGVYEEVFLLGYLMRGLRRYGASTALGITLLVRLIYHMYQGPVGALAVLLFGAVVGLYFQRTGRLFPAVAAHVIADAVGLGSM